MSTTLCCDSQGRKLTPPSSWPELIHLGLAELELLRGEPEGAVARLEPLAERKGGKVTLIQTTLAWAQLERGEVDGAEELAKQAVRRGREQQEGLTLPDALRVQGMALIRLGRHEEARRVLEEGLALARGMPYPCADARVLFQLGMMHAQQHEPELARESLEEALAIFRRLGARKDIERTEHLVAGLATVEDLTTVWEFIAYYNRSMAKPFRADLSGQGAGRLKCRGICAQLY